MAPGLTEGLQQTLGSDLRIPCGTKIERQHPCEIGQMSKRSQHHNEVDDHGANPEQECRLAAVFDFHVKNSYRV